MNEEKKEDLDDEVFAEVADTSVADRDRLREALCEALRGTPEGDSPIVTMTADAMKARDACVKAIGSEAHALIRQDGRDPAVVASALLWCALSMYAQGAPDLERATLLELCGKTWDEVKQFLAELAKVPAKDES